MNILKDPTPKYYGIILYVIKQLQYDIPFWEIIHCNLPCITVYLPSSFAPFAQEHSCFLIFFQKCHQCQGPVCSCPCCCWSLPPTPLTQHFVKPHLAGNALLEGPTVIQTRKPISCTQQQWQGCYFAAVLKQTKARKKYIIYVHYVLGRQLFKTYPASFALFCSKR